MTEHRHTASCTWRDHIPEHQCKGAICPTCHRVRHWDMVLLWCAGAVAIVCWCGVLGAMIGHGVWWPAVASLAVAVAFYAWVWHLATRR